MLWGAGLNKRRKPTEHRHQFFMQLPDCGCSVTTHLMLLALCFSLSDGLYLLKLDDKLSLLKVALC